MSNVVDNKNNIDSVTNLAAIIVIGLLAYIATQWQSPNSDALFPLVFVNDLLHGSAPFNWIMTPANGLFPDILMVMAARILGFDGRLNFAFFAVVYNILVFLSFFSILWSAGASRVGATTAGFAGSLLFSFAYYSSSIQQILYSPAHHQGVLPILGFIIAALAVFLSRNWDQPTGLAGTKALMIGTVLVALTLLSDFLLFVQLLAPAYGAFACLAWLHRKDAAFPAIRKTLLLACGALGVGAVLGLVAYKFLNSWDTVRQGTTGIHITPHNIRTAFKMFVAASESFPSFIGAVRYYVMIIGLIVESILVVLMMFRKAARLPAVVNPHFYFPTPAAKFVFITLIFSSFASVLAPILVGTWVDNGISRQQLPVVAFPPLVLGWLLLRWGGHVLGLADRPVLRRLASYGSLTAVVVAGGAFLVSYGEHAGQQGSQVFLQDYRRMAATLRGEMIGFVLAQYWTAKPLVQGAEGSLDVCGIADTGGVYPWITNLGWCARMYRNWSSGKGQLAIIADDSHIHPAEVEAQYGTPGRAVTMAGFKGQSWVYPWSQDLDARVRDAVCNAYADKQFNKPDFCG
jgi:hypothetical protein